MAPLVALLLVARARALVFHALDGHSLCLMLRTRDLAAREACHEVCWSMGARGRKGGIVLLMPWLLNGGNGEDATDCRCKHDLCREYSEDWKLGCNVWCLLCQLFLVM